VDEQADRGGGSGHLRLAHRVNAQYTAQKGERFYIGSLKRGRE
jgi:hypothetical protein